LDKILLVTHSSDYTADYIIKKYPKVDFFRLNTDLISNYSIEVTEERIEIFNKVSNNSISTINCVGVYYRRIMLPDFNNYEPIFIHALTSDFISYIEGIIEVFSSKVLTRPSILKRADNKVVQSQLARKFNLKMPKSLISNNEESVREFISPQRDFIVKPLSVGRVVTDENIKLVQTNLVNKNLKIPKLGMNPTYFQSYIEKSYELRITVINKNIFSVKIYSLDKVDWRSFNNDIQYELTDIPKELEEKCISIMNDLNINFAAFDFIFNGNEYYFLELNANGQWLWLEEELGLNISLKIIDYLLEGE
jgi:glutathione synthase/RimK-type ligase-like ATP-grasp enzyme